jgi:hypothetical protein
MWSSRGFFDKEEKRTSLTVSIRKEMVLNLGPRKAFFFSEAMPHYHEHYFLVIFFVKYHSEAFYYPGGNKTRLLPETVLTKGPQSVYSNGQKTFYIQQPS